MIAAAMIPKMRKTMRMNAHSGSPQHFLRRLVEDSPSLDSSLANGDPLAAIALVTG